jgi:hypothetical protein
MALLVRPPFRQRAMRRTKLETNHPLALLVEQDVQGARGAQALLGALP